MKRKTKNILVNIASIAAGVMVALLIFCNVGCRQSSPIHEYAKSVKPSPPKQVDHSKLSKPRIKRTQDEFTDKVTLTTDMLKWYDPFQISIVVKSWSHKVNFFDKDIFLIMVALGESAEIHINDNPIRFIADSTKWGAMPYTRMGTGAMTYKLTKKALWVLANSETVKMRVTGESGQYVFVIPEDVKAVLSELYLKFELETW